MEKRCLMIKKLSQMEKIRNSSVDSARTISHNNSKLSSAISKKAMKNYLQNLLYVEISLLELKKKRNSILRRVNDLQGLIGYRSYKIPGNSVYRVHFRWSKNRLYILTYDPQGLNRPFVFLDPLVDKKNIHMRKSNLYRKRLLWRDVASIYKKLINPSSFELPIWGRGYASEELMGNKYAYRSSYESFEENDAIEAFVEGGNEMYLCGAQIYAESYEAYQSAKSESESVDKKIKEAEGLRNRLYNLNIIPEMHRNIRSIYFINKYIQTSKGKIDPEFLQLDLDTIKKKLDDVI